MKQLFHLAVITFSLILLVACGGQHAIQVEKISVIPTSANSTETKELIKVSSNAEIDDEDAAESEASEENNKEEEKEITVADASEDIDDETTKPEPDANQSTNESTNSDQSTSNTNQQKNNINDSEGNSNNQTANTDTSKSKDSKNTNTPSQPRNEQPSSKPKQKETAKPAPAPKTTAFVSVESPSDLNGPNLAPTEVEITEGETALAATLRALNSKGISIDYTGSGATGYVKSIGGLGEFDAGPLSGWNVFVEGVMIPRSADAYEIFNGYKVHWRYTKNYLED
ncbi:DUF4430 domain-containing protein [Oceanobacillus alkalisoli]|uniref:DUF4430 domain-containing protein n=1 Tax=Oceanobacillus alkalisoli TaxID=2925113 RepID=UPI001EE3B135|nr:DUF4430 domain-containing protein [Oceanobacillus alkalisoli]MCG5103743.1 DUF4430 domain-containing protein [Oceanobacillus alkalisoli]